MTRIKHKELAKPKYKTVETRIKDLRLIEMRRRQIAEGAIKVFVAKGYHKATVREIVEASGMTMGSMYNYVRTKEDIMYLVYEYVTRALRDDLMIAIAGVDNPRNQLKAALKHNLEALNRHSDVIMFLYQASGSLDRESLHDVLARETEYIEIFEDLVRKNLSGRQVSEFKVKLAADILSYLGVIVTLRRWSLKRRFKSTDEVLDGILDFMLHGLAFLTDDGAHLPGAEEK
ncbi:MAG: TetR/AcrR family transcriptional regulator [Desulfomonilaceae bacterium]